MSRITVANARRTTSDSNGNQFVWEVKTVYGDDVLEVEESVGLGVLADEHDNLSSSYQ